MMNEGIGMAQAVAGIFIGIGFIIIVSVMSYLMYQLTRVFKNQADKDEKYCLLEEVYLCEYAQKKHGIDLEKEIAKRKMFKPGKNFRKRLENEIYDDLFKEKKVKG